MRIGPRTALACLFAFAALTAPAQAANSLSVFVDNNEIALGAATFVAAHAETDADYGGGRVVWKFRGADTECAGTPDADDGSDATGDAVASVNPGAGVADVGGQMIQLDVGYWRICGWLVDDGTGAAVAAASTVVHVVPYEGSIAIRIRKLTKSFQFTLSYTTSASAHLYAALLRGSKGCPRSPTKVPRSAVMLVPRGGRYIGSDGGLGRSVKLSQLTPGPWRACAWLKSDDIGGVGPTSKLFAVPSRKRS